MIRINLLPVREARRKADLQQLGMTLGMAFGLAIVAAGLFHWMMIHEISSARERVTQMTQQIEAFKPQLAQVEEYRAKKADMEKKLGVIKNLDRSRSGPVHMLDELATHAPERLWLDKLEATGGGLTVAGMSLDNEVVAVFMKALEDSPYFHDVELKATELTEVGGLKLNKFEIHATLTNPDAAPVTVGAPVASPAAAPVPAPTQTASAAAR